MRRIICLLTCLVLLTLLIPGMASANSIFKHTNTTVPAGQTVDDLYVAGGNAEVFGQVNGVAAIVNGDLHLGSTAEIKGVVVVIGGDVKQDSGAVLGDDIYTISLDSATQNSLLIGGGLALGVWVLQLAGSLLMILVPVLIRIAGRQKIAAFTARYPASLSGRLIYTGLLSGLILAALSTLLLVTVTGIPFLIVILLVMLLALAFGTTVISYRIGERVCGPERRNDWVKVLAGAAILTAFINIPIAGGLLLILVWMISLGIVTQWIFRRRK